MEKFPTFCLCMMPPLRNSASTFVASFKLMFKGCKCRIIEKKSNVQKMFKDVRLVKFSWAKHVVNPTWKIHMVH
jgi:Zn-finger protein